MKKLSDEYRLRQRRINDDRCKRATRKDSSKQKISGNKKFAALGNPIIKVPVNYNLTSPEKINEASVFINQIYKECKTKNLVFLDFSDTVKTSAAAITYLYSVVDGLIKNDKKIRVLSKKSNFIKDVLEDSNFLKLCGHEHKEHSNILPITSGIKDKYLEKIVTYSLSNMPSTDQNNAKLLVRRAVMEAMLNVDQHAYPMEQDKNGKTWWIITKIIGSKLYIIICDHGVGIPETIKQDTWIKKIPLIRSLEIGKDDHQMIQVAMKYTRSSRRVHTGGGLGSRDIQNLILNGEEGYLIIISGKGFYKLESNHKESSEKFTHKIKGTIIQWCIPVTLDKKSHE